MRVAEPLVRSWKARLALEFSVAEERTRLSGKVHDGPLVVQKPLYPEGGDVCHAIIVHPPGGIAGGDELLLEGKVRERASALLTTPGATKWYRSGGPWAGQKLRFDVHGTLEWLPQESIVFDGARAQADCEFDLAAGASLIGWDLVCLGRTGSGERYARGSYRSAFRVKREGRPLWLERGRVDGGGRLMVSPAGLGGKPVFGTLFAASSLLDRSVVENLRKENPLEGKGAITLLPGILLARYLGESTEAARRYFVALWRVLRPALLGREAIEPRIWAT